MRYSWPKAYEELTSFIVNNRDIRIESQVVDVPINLRSQFYDMLFKTRAAFIEERFENLINRSNALISKYNKIAEDIVANIGLEGIELPVSLQTYISNPKQTLVKSLFNLLLNLLKGELNISSFEETAVNIIDSEIKHYIRQLYEKWVILTIVKLINPDQIMGVASPRSELIGKFQDGDCVTPIYEEYIPPPKVERIKEISFNHDQYPGLTVPDLILRVKETGGFISVRSGYRKAHVAKSVCNDQREWYPISLDINSLSKLVLIYVSSLPEEIAIIADREMICRPDIIIKCIYNMDELNTREEITIIHDFLKPKVGTVVVILDSMLDDPSCQQESILNSACDIQKNMDLRFVKVGLDHTKLQTITDAILKHKQTIGVLQTQGVKYGEP